MNEQELNLCKDYMRISKAEFDSLSEADQKKYKDAAWYCKQESACGPYGGWVKGHELLKELGWTETLRSVGHRSYVKLHRPESINSS